MGNLGCTVVHMEKLEIYTDGGCSAKNKVAGWAYAVWDSLGNKIVSESGVLEEITNNQCELYAVLEALHYVHSTRELGKVQVTIVSDSEYVVNGCTTWLGEWKRKNWKTVKGQVKNKPIWEAMDELMRGLDVKFVWTRGHSANKKNNLVDKLAVGAYTEFLKKRKAKLTEQTTDDTVVELKS